jgi:hypothetical protein
LLSSQTALTVIYLKRFIIYFQMSKKMAKVAVTIVPATTAYEQQLSTYTNSDPGYVIWEVKI